MTKYKYFGKLMIEADKHSFGRRKNKDKWLSTMTEEELNWCLKHKFMKSSEPLVHLGESSSNEYYELTKLGSRLYDWYVYDTWFYIKHIVLHWNFWKYKVGHNFMRKVFKKHYDYEDYYNYNTLNNL